MFLTKKTYLFVFAVIQKILILEELKKVLAPALNEFTTTYIFNIDPTLMKKILLASIAFVSMSAMATNFYPAPESMKGDCMGVSDNGKYAVWTDDEGIYSYIWNADDPENPTLLQGILLMDITDDGVAVGSQVRNSKKYPGYYKNGEWTDLQITPKTLNTSEASCVTPDGKTIAGYLYCKSSASMSNGGYFPARWDWDDSEGDYVLTLYDDLDYDQGGGFLQGMYITSISPDGKVMAGSFFWGFSAQINAIIKDGELKFWDKLEVRQVPWYFQGKYMDMETAYFINGFRDAESTNTFSDVMYSNDNKGNFYCCRTKVLEITDEEMGEGSIQMEAAVYNYLTDEWTWNENYDGWPCGIDQKYEFTFGPNVVIDGKKENIVDYWNVDTGSLELSHVSKMSMDGKILGGATRVYNPATGMDDYTPFIIELDKPLIESGSAAPQVFTNGRSSVVVGKGRIDFCGEVGEVYTTDGKLVGKGTSVELIPGIYVARTGNESCRVLVK